MDQEQPQTKPTNEAALSALELFQVFDTSKQLGIWELLSALKKYSSDPVILPLICQKLSTLDTKLLDFFLPQLCQLILDKGNNACPIRRLLIDTCRKSIRTGILASFFFRSATADNTPNQNQLCQRMEVDIEHAVLSGNKNKDLHWQIELFQRHCDELTKLKTHQQEEVKQKEDGGSGVRDISLPPDSVEEIYNKVTEMTEVETVDLALEDGEESEKPAVPAGDQLPENENQPIQRPIRPNGEEIRTNGQMKGKEETNEKGEIKTGEEIKKDTHGKEESKFEIGEESKKERQDEALKDCSQIVVPELEMKGSRVAVETKEPNSLRSSQDSQSDMTESGKRRVISPIDILPRCKMCGQVVDPSESISHTKVCDVMPAPTPRPSLSVLNNEILGNKLEKLDLFTYLTCHIVGIQNQGKSSTLYHTLLDDLYISTKNLQPVNPQIKETFIKMQIPFISRSLSYSDDSQKAKTLSEKNGLPFQISMRKVRREYFKSQLLFIKTLTDISTLLKNMNLKDKTTKNSALQHALTQLNQSMSSMRGIYIPILSPDATPYRVVRIPPKESLCLNSRDRVPFLINVEVVSGLVEAVELLHGEPNSATRAKANALTERINSPIPEATGKWLSDSFQVVENYAGSAPEDDWTLVGDVILPLEKTEEVSYLDQIFGADWETRKKKIRVASPMGPLPGWDLLSVIVKAGDDLRQEQLAMQLIQLFADIFAAERIFCLQLTPYMVLATSGDAGLIETVHDAISIHGLKASEGFESLLKYFEKAYPTASAFQQAQRNFIESVAAYSLVTYLLQIKDRHNGNILIDRKGRIIHIDYGFMLSSSPGNIAFEKSPFKLSQEMLEVMGGKDGERFTYFQFLFQAGFLALRKNYTSILTTIELMLNAGGGMACFKGSETTIQNLKERFKLDLNDSEVVQYCNELVEDSCGNWRTGAYDNFQYWSNGIL